MFTSLRSARDFELYPRGNPLLMPLCLVGCKLDEWLLGKLEDLNVCCLVNFKTAKKL